MLIVSSWIETSAYISSIKLPLSSPERKKIVKKEINKELRIVAKLHFLNQHDSKGSSMNKQESTSTILSHLFTIIAAPAVLVIHQ